MIGGEWADASGGEAEPVYDPATEEVAAETLCKRRPRPGREAGEGGFCTNSFYDDLHIPGKDGVRFFTENEVETSRFFSDLS